MHALRIAWRQLEPELRERWRRTARSPPVAGHRCSAGRIGPGSVHRLALRALRRGAGEGRQEEIRIADVCELRVESPWKKPGEYPSGGPLPHLIDVWKAGAPSLDFLAPDIYFPNFSELAARYRRDDNVLFIPEANNAGKVEVPANAFYAFGQLDALGFRPFSIESIDGEPQNPLVETYACWSSSRR